MAMVAVTAALIGFFAFVIMRVTTPQMTTLFTDLSAEDSSGIIKDLERQAIPFELRNDGAVIMVPKDKVTRLRMKLAEGGLPKGGGVGYEIFDKSDALGTTSFVQNINHLRALEGELARTIRAIDRIQAARVHLVLPERPLFSRETPEPSASIVVRVRGALEPQQIRAIRHVVASAVNGLKPQRVSIVDEAGQLLADGATGDADNAIGDERRAGFEKRMRNQVEAIVSSVVGAGRARVQLSADFDYNKITQTSDRSIPKAGCCARARPAKNPAPPPTTTARSPSTTNCRATRTGTMRRGARPEQEERRNQQLRDFPHHQDRSDRGRTGQPHLGRGAGRRQLFQERQRRDGLSGAQQGTARPHRRAGALGDRLRPEARRPGRGRQPQIRRSAGRGPGRRADRPARHAAVHQGRRHVRHRARRHDAARLVVLFMVIRPLVKRILASEQMRRSPATLRCRR
jgi:flagellar basal-body M-ring protein/flagellar hook-basal body protein fliF